MELSQIQKRIEQLESAQDESRKLKILLDDALKEDDQYQQVDAELRDLGLKKKQLKDGIWGQKSYQEALAKMKDVKEEIRDMQEILNHELMQWYEAHKSDEIVGLDGATRKLKINIRLLLPRSLE